MITNLECVNIFPFLCLLFHLVSCNTDIECSVIVMQNIELDKEEIQMELNKQCRTCLLDDIKTDNSGRSRSPEINSK